MDYSGITFNNHNSTEFGLYVKSDDFSFTNAERDIVFNEVAGFNGSIIADNNSFKNITQSFNCIVIKSKGVDDVLSLKRNLLGWLRTTSDYTPLHFSGLPGYFWEAICYESTVYTRVDAVRSTITINFNCKPFLKSDSGTKYIEVPKLLFNEESWPSEPLIHLKGNGTMTVTINGISYKLIGVDGEVFIDSENQLVYKNKTTTRNGIAVFPNHNFPVLKSGKNEISVSGATYAEIKPNWRVLA